MAVAIGILVEIVLMILLGGIEILQRQFLYHQWLLIVFLFLSKDLLYDRQVSWVGIINARAIACALACALVVSLLVETGWVDGLEKHLQQEFEADHVGTETHEYGLGKARLVGIYLFICRILGMSVGKSHLREDHTFNLFEKMFCTPETATGKIYVLCGLRAV